MLAVRIIIALSVLLGCHSILLAQNERYELGRHLREFENAWEKQSDPAARKRALAILPKVTEQFFSFQFGEAARTLDQARFALRDQRATDEEIWVASLCLSTSRLIVDAEAKEIEITASHFYNPTGKQPDLPNLLAGIPHLKRSVGIGKKLTVPFTMTVSLPRISMREKVHNQMRSEWDQIIPTGIYDIHISRIQNLKSRMERLKKGVEELPSPLETIEQATLKDNVKLLAAVIDGEIPESDIRYGDLLAQMETLHSDNKPIFSAKNKLSWDWSRISFPTGVKRNTLPTRIVVPKTIRSHPAPIVIALHGAGGSENMFIESYGAGQIVKECEKRNWLLVTTRSPGFVSPPDVKIIIDQIAERFPIDRSNIFLVGHSMGAAQTIELCQKHNGLFAGAGILGGAGRIRDFQSFLNFPLFVGVGEKEFALPSVRNLKKALDEGGAKKMTYQEYPDLEHLVIVREALPDVFRLFDQVVAAKQKSLP